jgi:soluble cytochrome b562
MDKEKLLIWIEKSISDLEAERDHNEDEYKKGKFPHWKHKDYGYGLGEVMDSYWGYQSLIFQLDNIKKLINKGNFD